MSERNADLYLEDIFESCNAILEFTIGMSFEQFKNDRKTYSAVIREFEVIGEAVGKLPDHLKQELWWCGMAGYKRLSKPSCP